MATLKNLSSLVAGPWNRGLPIAGTTSHYLNLATRSRQQRLNYSTSASSQDVITTLDPTTGIAIVKLNSPPVNCMSSTLMRSCIDSIESLEQDPNCQALILASGSSPAMGCILALCCDHRIMKTGKGTIGLNETHLGIPLVPWIIDLFVNAVGQRQAERGITRGLLYEAEEALRIGLIDEVASSEEDLLKRSMHQAQILAKLPSDARHESKMGLRQALLDRHELAKENSERTMVGNITSDEVQTAIEDYLKQLKSRK